MYTLTTPVDPSIIPSDSPPQSQNGVLPPTSSAGHPSTGWKLSSTNNKKPYAQNPLESWKTSSSSSLYSASTASLSQQQQYQRHPRPLPHVPTPPSSFDSNQHLPATYYQQQHRQSMPAGGFMNESFHYDQMNDGNIYHSNNGMTEHYTSTPSLHQFYQQCTLDPQNQYYYQQGGDHDYYGDTYNQYQQSYPMNHQIPQQHPYYEQPQQHPWQENSAAYTEWAESAPSSTPSPVLESHQISSSSSSSSSSPKASAKDKKSSSSTSERNVRQITVRSVNKEHRVWIDILPTETGLSLAAKIHRIATFGTRKILKITTTHGRTIPLDNRPIFGSWMDMTRFENGEHWQVEWGSLDKSMVDKFFSKVIQVGGSSRYYAAQKQDSSRDKKTG